MARSICIINGHPDAGPGHFVPALADAYERGARAAGHAVSRIDVAGLPVDFLHNETEFAEAPGPPVAAERDKMAGADHLVLIYPLWLGGMPARLKAFLEQAARAGFFIGKAAREGGFPTQAMKGKSARVIVTMGMPVFAYHLLFGGHSVKGVEAGILRIAGYRPVRRTLFGNVEGAGGTGRARMLERVEALGRRGR